jgi:hypothetical protein
MISPPDEVRQPDAELVRLHVGQHYVCLSDACHRVEVEVRALETLLKNAILDQGLIDLHGRDLLIVAIMRPAHPEGSKT